MLFAAQDLVAEGYKEVTLLGQNIDSWGRDLSPPQKFADLLRDLGATPGLARMRFVTSHPKYMSERVIDAVRDVPALCEMFHIPFQVRNLPTSPPAILAAISPHISPHP